MFVGFFKTNPAAGHKGISAFIIDADAPGVTVGAHENKMGLRLSNTTDLIFENVRVKASPLVGPEGSGFKLAMNALNLSRAFVATLAVGIMQRALDESVKYAKERKQFNTPIIKFQMVQQMLADMATKNRGIQMPGQQHYEDDGCGHHGSERGLHLQDLRFRLCPRR